ncbi:MAG TPA: hypothetical protein VFP59_11205 [Candidatus Angelobacter sp.]|nr:hypothetical protein [Candidatus Angelobacter sp.]
MEIPLTPELEARLHRVAAATRREAEEIVRDVVQSYLDHDEWFRNEVGKGLRELDEGNSLGTEDVVKRIERLFQP